MNNDKDMKSGTGGVSPSVSSGVAKKASDLWQRHPLVQHQYINVLPADLLPEIEYQLDADYCKQPLWQVESRLSSMAAKENGVVGFWDGRHGLKHLFSFAKHHRPKGVSKSLRNIRGEARSERKGKKREPFLDFQNIICGYCGWLMTCKPFLQEHDALVDQVQNAIGTNSLLTTPQGPFHALAGRRLDASDPLEEAYWDLCRKWHLIGLMGPYLPVPAVPTHQILTVSTPIQKEFSPGRLVNIPVIYGDLPASQVAVKPSSEVSPTPDYHLKPWLDIMSSGNRSKGRQVQHYMRQFSLLHIWRALQQRHGHAIQRKTGPIREVLASYVSISPCTIRWSLAGL